MQSGSERGVRNPHEKRAANHCPSAHVAMCEGSRWSDGSARGARTSPSTRADAASSAAAASGGVGEGRPHTPSSSHIVDSSGPSSTPSPSASYEAKRRNAAAAPYAVKPVRVTSTELAAVKSAGLSPAIGAMHAARNVELKQGSTRRLEEPEAACRGSGLVDGMPVSAAEVAASCSTRTPSQTTRMACDAACCDAGAGVGELMAALDRERARRAADGAPPPASGTAAELSCECSRGKSATSSTSRARNARTLSTSSSSGVGAGAGTSPSGALANGRVGATPPADMSAAAVAATCAAAASRRAAGRRCR